MKTYVRISCSFCGHNDVYQYRGHKDVLVCEYCSTENPEIVFVEWRDSEWLEVSSIGSATELGTHYVNVVAMALYGINNLPLIEMTRDVSTSKEIYKNLDDAVERINRHVVGFLNGLKTTNHLMDIMSTAWSINQDFDANVQTFLDAVIKDIARNPDNHHLYGYWHSAFPLGQIIFDHFPDLPDEYTDEAWKGVTEFLNEYSLADMIFQYENRASDMLNTN